MGLFIPSSLGRFGGVEVFKVFEDEFILARRIELRYSLSNASNSFWTIVL
jgi:hypothetical protein